MLEQLNQLEWRSFPQPEWNSPGELPAAIRAVAAAASDSESRNAYNRLLYAVGNNHAGTYFPAVLQVVPFLGEILEHGGLQARLRCLDILIDLIGSFSPELGFEQMRLADGTSAPLETVLRTTVAEMWNKIALGVRRHTEDPREAALAADLSELLADPGQE